MQDSRVAPRVRDVTPVPIGAFQGRTSEGFFCDDDAETSEVGMMLIPPFALPLAPCTLRLDPLEF